MMRGPYDLVSSGILFACLYSLEPSSIASQPYLYSYYLNTDTINQFLASMNRTDLKLDLPIFQVSIDAVCNIITRWDYLFYEIPSGFDMTVNSRITFKSNERLLEGQAGFLLNDTFVRHKIVISQWDREKSTFNTLSLPESKTKGRTRAVFNPDKAYHGSKIQLFGETLKKYLSTSDKKDPEVGSDFDFPSNYTCIFRSEANDINYDVKSTGRIILVQPDPGAETWQTMCMPKELTTSHFPTGKITNKAGMIRERRVYLKNNGTAATTVHWIEKNLKYWLTVVSTPLPPDETWSQWFARWGKLLAEKGAWFILKKIVDPNTILPLIARLT